MIIIEPKNPAIMKKFIILAGIVLLPLLFTNCGVSNKATSQRRGLMMPELHEVQRNKEHFKPRKERKPNKHVKRVKRRSRR